MRSVEENEYKTELEDELEVFPSEPNVTTAEVHEEKVEMKIEVTLEMPYGPYEDSKEDQPLVLMNPPLGQDYMETYLLKVQDELKTLKEGMPILLPKAMAEKLGRPPTALELCLYFRTKDHDGVTFLDSRVEKIVTVIRRRWIELTQSQPDTPIDDTELYLSVVERDDKGRTYGLGWTPSGSRRRRATAGGAAGGGDGAGSSQPISSPNEPIELLQRDLQEMHTHILRVMQDHTLTQDQLREVQG
ncbi:hypothetical protein Scep_029912 [Stephania cephalantha]|uniref:Uncharacterized protein n=1 Tax=Stephania cephalantha TaxID=152367 RepID=A0AAP0DYM2_9MAGN